MEEFTRSRSTTASIVIAFGVSALVGVVFGIYPALKAARIDSIDALRYEQPHITSASMS